MVSKAKYEDQYTKGKMGKRLDDCKERYHKATRKLHSTHNEYGVVHQIVSPISNSESTNFCYEYLLWSSFSTGKQTEEKNCFGPIFKKFVSFSNFSCRFLNLNNFFQF